MEPTNSGPCSRSFFSAVRMQKPPSEHSRPPEKTFCYSIPTSFNNFCKCALMPTDKALEASSSSTVFSQLLRSRRSPFFGRTSKRILEKSLKSADNASDVASAAVPLAGHFTTFPLCLSVARIDTPPLQPAALAFV